MDVTLPALSREQPVRGLPNCLPGELTIELDDLVRKLILRIHHGYSFFEVLIYFPLQSMSLRI